MDTAVGLVESYLRLNGYFTLPELQVLLDKLELGLAPRMARHSS